MIAFMCMMRRICQCYTYKAV